MGKSMTVEIDEASYQEIKRLAQERGLKMEETMAELLKAYLEQRKAYVNDPFFQIGKAGCSGLGDLAEAHDKYLYGSESEDGR
jgi:hypothetical protein